MRYDREKLEKEGDPKLKGSTESDTTVRDFGYSYDPIGNRLRSSRNSTNPAAATGANLGIHRRVAIRAGTTTTYTLYDGWNPIMAHLRGLF